MVAKTYQIELVLTVHFMGRMSASRALQFQVLCSVFQVLVSEKTREATGEPGS